MIRNAPCKLWFGMVSALCLTICSGIAPAQVTITPNVTLTGGGVYHYDYTITNATPDDLFDVSIHVLPGANSVFNVTAPAGFKGLYTDSVLGLVDYLEDTSLFTATPLSGFTYDSFLAPQASVFDANRLDLLNGGIITTTDATVAAVPEPGSLALPGSLAAAACLAVRKRRRYANTK